MTPPDPTTTDGDVEYVVPKQAARRFWMLYDEHGYYAVDWYLKAKAARRVASDLNREHGETRWKVAKYERQA